jgi:S-phase kinase-associated protein 1
MAIIKLQSSNGDIFPIDVVIAKKSNTIKTMLESLGIEEGSQEEAVPLPNVTTDILKKVIEWCTVHKDDPEPDEDSDEYWETRTNEITGWDVDFFKMDQATLFELILAANYLDVKGLLDVACKAVSNLIIAAKTPEGIRKAFNVKNDFTPMEEWQARAENKWHDEEAAEEPKPSENE